MRPAAVRICLTGRTRRRASNTLRPIPATRNAASRSAVRQIFARTGANAALSGCSTNTFQPTGPTVAQVLSTSCPRKLRPTVDPLSDEASALVTWGRAKERFLKAALFGCAMGTPLASIA